MYNKFFGSKLNTILLLVLIILIIVSIGIMLKNKETYFPEFSQNNQQVLNSNELSQISGNKDDLVSFSILPGSKVHGIVSYRGVIKGGYFFEANILVGVTDTNKKIILQSNGVAKTDWMTVEPISFEGYLDFSKLPKGPAYIEIHNDNASGLAKNDKSIFIPIVIE